MRTKDVRKGSVLDYGQKDFRSNADQDNHRPEGSAQRLWSEKESGGWFLRREGVEGGGHQVSIQRFPSEIFAAFSGQPL